MYFNFQPLGDNPESYSVWTKEAVLTIPTPWLTHFICTAWSLARHKRCFSPVLFPCPGQYRRHEFISPARVQNEKWLPKQGMLLRGNISCFIMQEENKKDTICIWKRQSRGHQSLMQLPSFQNLTHIALLPTVIDKLISETIFSYLKREIGSPTRLCHPFS